MSGSTNEGSNGDDGSANCPGSDAGARYLRAAVAAVAAIGLVLVLAPASSPLPRLILTALVPTGAFLLARTQGVGAGTAFAVPTLVAFDILGALRAPPGAAPTPLARHALAVLSCLGVSAAVLGALTAQHRTRSH